MSRIYRAHRAGALFAVLGLSAAVHASAISGVAVDVSISGAPQGNSSALYDSQAFGGNFGTNVGLTYTLGDPTAALTTIPAATGSPLMMPGGQNAVSLDLTAVGSSVVGGANLATGLTNLEAVSSNGNATTETEIGDNVTMLDGLTFGQSAQIGVNFSLTGSVLEFGDAASYTQEVLMSLGNSQLQWSAFANSSNGGSSGSQLDSGTENWAFFTVTNQTISSINFTGWTHVTAGQHLQFELQQSMNCNVGAECNFLDPGQISLILPPGETYTSDSGVFLTSASNGVPEPSISLLVGAGLLALGAMRYRHNSR